MTKRNRGRFLLAAGLLLASPRHGVAELTLEGGPSDTGFNVGTLATLHATLRGIEGEATRYAVFAEIQYAGTTSTTSVQMNALPRVQAGAADYEVDWPIPPQAPTGLYTLTLRAEDRAEHQPVAAQKVQGFAVYKKSVRIALVTLDRTFYTVGQLISCQVVVQNLSDSDLKDLRVEFSNANYPWISLYGNEGHDNPELALRTLREHLNIPAGGAATIPMMPAGRAALLQGQQKEVVGSGLPKRNDKVPPPEVDMYTIAVWNGARTELYDMQFTTPAIVRPWDRHLPIPYSRNYTHPYNADLDFTKYREFYPPGMISPAISVARAHTFYQPGDNVTLQVTATNLTNLPGLTVMAKIQDPAGAVFDAPRTAEAAQVQPGRKQALTYEVWTIPSDAKLGIYTITLTTPGPAGVPSASTTLEIAVNRLPASLLVINPHEDDEHAYAGLIRAAVEAQIPIQAVILTGGDVGVCERYYDKPCGPNEAHEFGKVRMEEAREAFEHLGLARDRVEILGLPDGGSGEIWFHHQKSSDPFLSIYLACDHSPYDNVYKPNLPFARDAVLETLKKLILNFRPALIALPHPDERHVDHRTTNWFVVKACQELLKEKLLDSRTVILADQAYGSGGFKPAPYNYEPYIVHLSGEGAALKQEMSWIYQSQDGNLSEGERKTYGELPREEEHLRILDWQEHEGWNEQ